MGEYEAGGERSGQLQLRVWLCFRDQVSLAAPRLHLQKGAWDLGRVMCSDGLIVKEDGRWGCRVCNELAHDAGHTFAPGPVYVWAWGLGHGGSHGGHGKAVRVYTC